MADPRRVVLELDRESDPISGLLAMADGPPLAFSGWLELTALIEHAVSPDPPHEKEGQ